MEQWRIRTGTWRTLCWTITVGGKASRPTSRLSMKVLFIGMYIARCRAVRSGRLVMTPGGRSDTGDDRGVSPRMSDGPSARRSRHDVLIDRRLATGIPVRIASDDSSCRGWCDFWSRGRIFGLIQGIRRARATGLTLFSRRHDQSQCPWAYLEFPYNLPVSGLIAR